MNAEAMARGVFLHGLRDEDVAAQVAASSWERMQQESALQYEVLVQDHCRALEELLAAEMGDFHAPGVDAGVRLVCARVAEQRARQRVGR